MTLHYVHGLVNKMAADPGIRAMFLALLLLDSLISGSVNSMENYSIRPYCMSSSSDVYIQFTTLTMIELSRIDYRSNMKCRMLIRAPTTYSIMVQPLLMDIHYTDDLKMYDGTSTLSPSLGTFCCGRTDKVVTKGSKLLLEFESDSSSLEGDGFKLLLTPFHEGYCSDGRDFECKNGRCIDHSFYCNDYDNCGDNSDACYEDHLWWVWMIVGIIVFIVICVIITIVCCCLCKKSRPGTVIRTNPQSTTVHYSAGAQTAGVPGINPWHGTHTAQPQFQPQSPYSTAYPPVQGTNPATSFPGPPPSYTSVSGSSVYPAGYNLQTNSGAPSATTPESIDLQQKQ